MSRLRRLATLTCAGLAPFALAGSATLAPATATVPQSTPTSSPVATAAEALASPTGRAVVRFADVPSRAQLRALRGAGFGDAPGERLVVGEPHDEPPLAFHQTGHGFSFSYPSASGAIPAAASWLRLMK